ncbi:MAG TPA: hypothetical protein VHA53_03340 [Nitrolancea sp.]|nr:hypothetical protein [Nitrolancea sp.]
MTRCDVPDTDLIAYTDGELHGARREYVEVHLRVCLSCQARLAEILETTRLLQRATPLTDDPDGRARIKARLAAEAQRQPRPARRLPMLVAVPALMLIVLTVISLTWTTSPTQASMSLRSLIRRANLSAGPAAPSTVLTRDRLPGTAALSPDQTDIQQATFPTVVLPRLAGGLTLTSFTLMRDDYAELRYTGPNQLVIRLGETPAATSNATSEDSDQLVVISGTQVLWHLNRYDTSAIVNAFWVRNGVEFQLAMIQDAGPGVPVSVAQQIIQQIIAAQDNADG